MIDPQSAVAIADAVERDLLPEVRHAVEAGLTPITPTVIGIRRAAGGVAVMLDLGDGDHVERQVVLDPLAVDLRLRLAVIGAVISNIVAKAVRRSAAARRAPLTRGSMAP